MRLSFVEELTAAATKDKDIYLLTGDLGYSVFEPFIEKFPLQYINAGIAEQNMTGVAAGLALSGKTVFIYSIANFPTLRCLEQIRNDICYHNANVKIVSVGCGYSYGLHGYTHFGIEDISILRTLPNMHVISPADAHETRLAVRKIISHQGPCYLRLGNSREKILHINGLKNDKLPNMIPVIEANNKTVVLSVGAITSYVLDKLKESNIHCDLWSVPVVLPMDKKTLTSIVHSAKQIITVEEHQLAGGFGSAIFEALLDLKNTHKIAFLPEFHRIGIHEVYTKDIGNQDYLRNQIDFSALFNEVE